MGKKSGPNPHRTEKWGKKIKTQLPGFIAGILLTLIAAALALVLAPSTEVRKLKAVLEATMRIDREKIAGIEQLISDEATFSVRSSSQNDKTVENAYCQLFTDDAWIIDVQDKKPGAIGREQILARLKGLPKIIANNHALLFSPQVITENTALAQTETALNMNGQPYRSFDRWFFRKFGGAWRIQRFEYNLGASDR